MTKVKHIEQKPVFKSGFITMVGRSNSGKSTLLNTLVGTKLAAVTHKPQTTRDIIHGVLNTTQGQAIFIDTPGILKERHNPLAGKLTERAQEALKEIDEILYVVDPTKAIGAEERFILSILRKLEIPKFLILNKSDLPEEEKKFLEDYKQLSDEFTATFELSALLNRHIQPLKDMVFELLPEGMPMYEGDQITNLGKGKWIAEVIREKILLALRKEVPYSINVEVRDIEDKEDIIVIQAVILTSDARYKKMIIGAGGRSIKEIGIAARKELSTALNKKIYLELEVETDRHWEDRA
ncbi:MAG: GTPase Era [Candidatus Magasanikbacteria bacterium RIFOXYD2_FULL_36_9]|uniref:GTPase Era n=1 Tax=Candidatus Magasanikbacteria bacterium RIFOXYD2_FULL_36_9 TaxID=1798707 RepID=A0A1F6NYD4_9BACT|nr:MAG: GTPase Era [Candidatus Magasanikbacteria bacterium RIFOXYD2_FULL_36_9]